jgi:mono/diheme cytochrome c family protein
MRAWIPLSIASVVASTACGGPPPPAPLRPGETPTVVVAAAPAAASNEPKATPAAPVADLAEGGTIFVRYCAVCHGREGVGGIGPSLRDAVTIHGATSTVVAEGVPTRGMPAWRPMLTEEEFRAVVAYVEALPTTR